MFFYLLTALALTTDPAQAFLLEHGDWLKEVSQRSKTDSVEWLKDQLAAVSPMKKTSTEIQPGKCTTTAASVEPETNLFVFCSFSLPDEAWLALSADLMRTNGVFVLRGLPDDSFQELAQRIHVLRQKGVMAPIQINPQLFETHRITSVPTFVLAEKSVSDRLNGNISLSFALGQIGQYGELSLTARALQARLSEVP